MILHLSVCMSLCQCLVYSFVGSKSNFDFFEFAALKKYLSFCWFSLLAAAGRAVPHVYVWLWADFLYFSFQVFFRKFFLGFCVGATHVKIWSKVGGDSVSGANKRSY